VSAPEDLPPAAASYRQNRFQVPPDAAELLLIRHGESEPALLDAPAPLVGGQSDPALGPEGREQAELVAARLAAAGIAAIYVSTLRRTAETAAPLAARLGLVPRVEPALREVGLGEWEGGLFRKMVSEHHPMAMRMWAEERSSRAPSLPPSSPSGCGTRSAGWPPPTPGSGWRSSPTAA